MVSHPSFKIYLYGLLLIGTLGTTLAHHFVFNPQEEYKENKNSDQDPHENTLSPTPSQAEPPFTQLLHILIIFLLLIGAFSLRKLSSQDNTPPQKV